jgi:hypothetical protein
MADDVDPSGRVLDTTPRSRQPTGLGMRTLRASLSAVALVAAATTASADPDPAAPAAPPPAVGRTPPPYSLPWQLRPVAPGDVVRSDTAVAAYDTPDGGGVTTASTLLVAYKVTPRLAPLVRVAVVHDAPPAGDRAATLANPVLGAIWGRALAPDWKLGVFAAVALPLGTAGGDRPDPGRVAANRAAIAARSAMDNAMFAVNDHVLFGGAGVAYVAGGLTVQGEVTVLQLTRVRGETVQPDPRRTNFTAGLHVGYFVVPWLSAGAELRYQRWLSTPAAVARDPTGALRDTVTAAAGLRGHVELPKKRWLRPGVSYTRGLDDPMAGAGYDILQIDVPYAF